MIRSKDVWVALFAAVSFLLISCGSTPTADDTLTQELVDGTIEGESGTSTSDEETSLWSKIESSRQAAIDAGAKDANPKAFQAAEDEYNSLKNSNASEEENQQKLKDLNKRYQALQSYAEAVAKKAEIDENSFAKYNQSAYNEGNSLLKELDSSTDYGDAWNQKAFSANDKFGSVLTAAYKSLAQTERTEAFKAKRDADGIKCSVSRKTEYDKYVNNFKSGDQNYVTGNPKGALENYTKAKEGFSALYSEVSEARSKAQKAIDEAKKRVSESESTAQWADQTKPLGDENVDGIESDDAKLLEDDDFSQKTEVQIEEKLPEVE